MTKIILFDGVCNFCNHSVQFILKRDKDTIFQFASLQSAVGQTYRQNLKIPRSIDSLVLIETNQYYTKSTAALKICRDLNSAWKLFVVLLLIPKPLRDWVYDIISKNRYRWFGQTEACQLPKKSDRKRMLD